MHFAAMRAVHVERHGPGVAEVSTSVMMPVSACCRVLGQVKKSDGMVGSPIEQAGARSVSRSPAPAWPLSVMGGVRLLAADSDGCVDAGDHVGGMGGAGWERRCMCRMRKATREVRGNRGCHARASGHPVTGGRRSGQERRFSAQAGDDWIVRLRLGR